MKGYNLTNSVSTPVPSNGGQTRPNTNFSPEKSNHVTINNTTITTTANSPSNTAYTETKIEINSQKKVSYNAALTDDEVVDTTKTPASSASSCQTQNKFSDGIQKSTETGELKLKLGSNNNNPRDKVSFSSDTQHHDNRIEHYGIGVLKTKVMISGDSSCSDSGLEVRGGSSVAGEVRLPNMRQLYRTARVDQESDNTDCCSPSPHSSLLDAPLPPSLSPFPGQTSTQSSQDSKQCNHHSTIRIQQNAVRSGWI